jgi:hypothetical protein
MARVEVHIEVSSHMARQKAEMMRRARIAPFITALWGLLKGSPENHPPKSHPQ